MASYVVLINFTEQGARTAGESPKRAEAFKAAAAKLDVQVKSILWTLGGYDAVMTVEGSEEGVTAALLKGAALGNVRTTTLRAFTADEWTRIAAKAG